MKWKRFGSSLLAIVLVCCLIFNMMIVPAKALEITAVNLLSVAAAGVIASALIGAGYQRDIEMPEIFDGFVSGIQTSLEKAGLVVEGMIEVLGYKKDNGDTQYAIRQEMLETILDTAFTMGVATVGSALNGALYDGGTRFTGYWNYSVTLPVDGRVWWFSHNGSNITLVFATETAFDYMPCVFMSGGADNIVPKTIDIDGTLWYYATYILTGMAAEYYDAAFPQLYYESYVPALIRGEMLPEQDVTVAEGLKEGEMIIVDVSELEKLKEQWQQNGIEQEDPESGKVHPYWPILRHDTYEDVANSTQADVWEGLSDYTDTVLDNWSSLQQSLRDFKFTWSSIKSILQNILNLLGSIAEAITTPIVDRLSPMLEVLTAIKNGEITIPQALADVLRAAVVEPLLDGLQALFVPAEGYFDLKVEMLTSKFTLVQSVCETVDILGSFFQGIGSTPPVIWINLGASRGSLNLGGRVKFVDMTWYAEYKPTMDAVIAAFLYLWFVWRVAHFLPGILSGTSGMWGNGNVTFDAPFAPVVRTPLDTSKDLVSREVRHDH